MKFGKKLKIVSKKNLIVNLCTMKNVEKLKEYLIMEKST